MSPSGSLGKPYKIKEPVSEIQALTAFVIVGVTRHTDIIFYVIVFQKYNFLQTTGCQQIGQHFVAYGVK